jgi:peptidyl-prolyl isomerase G (cyclophilin G)
MANRGPNTNGSQWFVTLAACTHLTGKHVVFGRVVHGLEHIEAIGNLSTDERDRPLSPVIISRAGELELRAAPAPARPRTPSVSSDSEDEYRRRKRERRERKEREREERREERRAERKERRKHKERRRGSDDEEDRSRSKSKDLSRSASRSRSPRKERRRDRSPSETLSELDARLEREEKELLDKERLAKLQEMKSALDGQRQAIKDAGGVVYKGKFKDAPA